MARKYKYFLLSILVLLGTIALSPSVALARPAPLDDGSKNNTSSGSTAAAPCVKSTFFGLVPWYQYLGVSRDNTGTCVVQNFRFLPTGTNPATSDIPLVLLALVDDALRLAGLIAIGYIIYGGIQYVMSQGKPDAIAKAHSTIINALTGLVFAIIAVALVSFLGSTISS